MFTKLRSHVSRRVLVQLIIFGIISLGLFCAVIYDAVMGSISLAWVGGGLLAGVVVGYAVGKIFKLVWHEDTRKVIMSLDRMSFILIGAYVVFRIFSEQLLGHYLHGAALSAFSFAFLGGILLGRFVSVWRGTRRILKEQGVW